MSSSFQRFIVATVFAGIAGLSLRGSLGVTLYFSLASLILAFAGIESAIRDRK